MWINQELIVKTILIFMAAGILFGLITFIRIAAYLFGSNILCRFFRYLSFDFQISVR